MKTNYMFCKKNNHLFALIITLFSFFISNAQISVITNGNVGIGTATPNSKLDISGTLSFKSAGSTSSFGNGYNGGVDLTFANNGILRMSELNLLGTNDVLLQFMPPTTSGYGYLESWISAGMVIGTGTATPLIFRPNRTEAMRITSAGNVGIGTTGPSQKLEVVGNINLNSASNAFMINGNKILWNNGNIYDIFVGYNSGNLTMTGHQNTCVGMNTGASNTTGNYNCAFGSSCFNSNTTGVGNCAFGYIALSNSYSGSYNTGIGNNALTFNQTGKYNTALGSEAIKNNYYASSNTAAGNYALYNTIGSWNTAFGDSALRTNTTGTYNTALGYNANVSVNNLTNTTAIGYNASVGASNTIVLGNSSITALKCNVQTITALSDGRVKKNIRENVPGLEFIRLLRPVTYHLDIDKQNQIRGVDDKNNSADKYEVEKMQFDGFIAQEVEEASQKVGYNFSGLYKPKNNKDLYGLGYTTFVVPMVKAIQELDAKNNKLEIEIKQLQEIIQAQIKKQVNTEIEIVELKKMFSSISITQASVK